MVFSKHVLSRRDVLKGAAAAACLPGTGVSLAAPKESSQGVPVGLRKQLFVDDYVVSEKQNLVRELGKVTKANEGRPIFTEGRFYGSVLHDRGRFKMWYRHHEGGNYGYAESSDGIHFQRITDLTGVPFSGDFNMSVIIDPHETDPAHRFKAGFDAIPGAGAGLAHSADGIVWKPYNNGRAVTYRAADTYNHVVWDEAASVYRLFTRTDYGGQGAGPRVRTIKTDMEVRGTRSMTNPDLKADPTNWKLVRHWMFDREGPEEYLRRQIYALTDWISHGVHFALMTVIEWPSDFSEGPLDFHQRHERDIVNFYIGTSRDGDRWDLDWVYAGEPMIPRGGDGMFDKDMLFPASTVVTYDDRHWLYYSGGDERHGNSQNVIPHKFAIGLATLRLDGFIGLRAGAQPGTLVTRPFVLEGDQLEVNVAAESMQVEVLDQDGQALEEYSGANSPPNERIDSVRHPLRWRHEPDLSKLRGRPIQLRFRLERGALYAFQIR